LSRVNTGLQLVIGMITIGVGAVKLLETSQVLFA